jgi:preprotein translocase subunit SecG
MMLLIGFLTTVMVVICLFLILLVLMQLPKKEAGAGLAFGGAATDALFGSGSGNFLTKATKYSVVAFFVLAVVISILQNHYTQRDRSEFEQLLKAPQNQPQATPVTPKTAPVPAAVPAVAPATNLTLMTPTAISNAAPAK